MKRHIAAFCLVLAATLAFQAWFLGLTPHGREIGDASLSSAYTEALAHGQSYLLAPPDPQHPLLDTSLYHGRHYMYFGIVPFVTFMVPGYAVMGSAPSPEAAILFFCTVGYVAYGILLLFLIRRWNPGVSAALSAAAFGVLIFGSGTWPLMGRPAIYEIENAGAYGMFALSLLSLALWEMGNSQRLRWVVAASGFAALTIGCRPNYFPAVTVVACVVLWRAWKVNGDTAFRLRRTAAALAPLLGVGLALAAWNVHRFGDPLDFGLKHTVSEDPKLVRPLATLANFPYGAHRYAFGAARLIQYFPFIQGQEEGPFPLAPGQEASNQVYGFLVMAPVLLFGALLFRRSRRTAVMGPGCLAAVLLATFLGNFGFLSCVTMSSYRYPADFLGPLALLAALGMLSLAWVRSVRLRRTLKALVVPLVAWSLCALIFQTFSTAQTTDLFDLKKPAEFAEAARPFNHAVYLYESLRHDGPRGLALEVVLPGNRFGSVEPLVVDGENGAQDFLYLDYVAPGLLQVGFESTGRGGLLSSQVNVDYGKPHRIELRYGSFLPPDDHPLLAGFTAADRALARRMITVLLDDRPVLDGWADFHLPRGAFYVGNSTFDPAFGARFTGRILNVEYPRLLAKASPERWARASYGPLVETVELRPMPTGVLEPLLSLGLPGQGAQLLVHHLDGDRVQFVWLTTEGRRLSGPPVVWPSRERREVDVRAGALLPPAESSLWAGGIGPSKKAAEKEELRVLLSGQQVLMANLPMPDVSPTTLAPGRDTLFLTGGVMPSLSGSPIPLHRESW